MQPATSPLPSLLYLLLLFSHSAAAAAKLSVVTHPSKLILPPGHLVHGSPGARPGSPLACIRVQIHGLSLLRHSPKLAHALKVRLSVSQGDALFRIQTIELCFHKNESMQLGMCPASQWQKLSKDTLDWTMSPYEDKIFDMRMPLDPSRSIEVSTKEEFHFHGIVSWFFVLIMMFTVEVASKSHLIRRTAAIFTEVVKSIPIGRSNSLRNFVNSSIVVVGTLLLLHFLSGFLRAFLVGIINDIHNPSAVAYILFLLYLGLARAWFCYYGIYTFILTEGALIISTVLFLQSSLDLPRAMVAHSLAIVVYAITMTSSFLHHLFRTQVEFSHSTSCDADQSERVGDIVCQRSCEDYYSSYHRTLPRKDFSKKEWEEFTKEQTDRSLMALFSSPEFVKWFSDNKRRVSAAPDHQSHVKFSIWSAFKSFVQFFLSSLSESWV